MICKSRFVNRIVAPSQTGFTLVELVVTLVLIGIVALVSVPRFFDRQTFDQYGFFNETISAVRYAQKLAVATGCAVEVSVAANGYTLSQVSIANAATCNTPPYNTAVTDPANPNGTFGRTAPSGVTLTSAPAAFVFCPLGNTAAAAAACPNTTTVEVTVSVSGQDFRVWGATGFVERL